MTDHRLTRRALMLGAAGAGAGLASSCASDPSFTATPFVALVMGNTYKENARISDLNNTDNDMNAVVSSLRGASGSRALKLSNKFDTVRRADNKNVFYFKEELRLFGDAIEAANRAAEEKAARLRNLPGRADERPVYPTVFFYFAGHGFQFENENFLVPDVKDGEEIQVFRSSELLAGLRERAKAGIVYVLDACRDAPTSVFSEEQDAEINSVYPDALQRPRQRAFDISEYEVVTSGGSLEDRRIPLNSERKGLAVMPTFRDTMIIYSTGPNQSASDSPCVAARRKKSGGSLGPFAQHFQAELRIKQDIVSVLTRTIQAMKADYNTCAAEYRDQFGGGPAPFVKQIPWTRGNLGYQAYFAGKPVVEIPNCQIRPWACVD